MAARQVSDLIVTDSMAGILIRLPAMASDIADESAADKTWKAKKASNIQGARKRETLKLDEKLHVLVRYLLLITLTLPSCLDCL